MANFATVLSDLQSLKDNAVEVDGKLSAIKTLVEQLQAGGTGATPEQLDQLAGLVSEAASALQSAEDKADDTLA